MATSKNTHIKNISLISSYGTILFRNGSDVALVRMVMRMRRSAHCDNNE
jgi:hypothetical protein